MTTVLEADDARFQLSSAFFLLKKPHEPIYTRKKIRLPGA